MWARNNLKRFSFNFLSIQGAWKPRSCVGRYFSRDWARSIPNIVLNNGHEMPLIGLGTWCPTSNGYAALERTGTFEKDNESKEGKDGKDGKDGKEGKTTKLCNIGEVVSCAIDAGYKLFDCAHLYNNEIEVGKALQKKLKDKVVKRDDLFIVTKLWNTFHDPDNVICGCEASLENLCLDYIDLYLMHSPMGAKAGTELFPTENGQPAFADVDYVSTWRAMEDLVDKGLCKNIGISNFNRQQIECLIMDAKIRPQVLQIELHPYNTQKDLVRHALCNDISVMVYASLGSPCRPWANKHPHKILLQDFKVTEIAKKHKRTNAQILLRYAVQLGYGIIPQAMTVEHLYENMNILNFELCPEDILNLDSLNHNFRFFPFTGIENHPHYPFAARF